MSLANIFASKRRWQDPEEHKKQKERLKGNQNTRGKHWKIKDTSKMSKARRDSWQNLEYRRKQIESRKRKWQDLEYHKKQVEKLKGNTNVRGKHWKVKDTSKMKEAQNRSEVQAKKRKWHINHPNKNFSNTSIEQKIAKELDKRQIKYQQNIGLCNIANVDFYLSKNKIVIECDGDYYHTLLGRKEHDAQRDRILIFNGFNVYRFWEHEINESSEKCIDKIFK